MKGYTVNRWDNGAWNPIQFVNAPTTTATDPGRPLGSTLYYALSATDNCGATSALGNWSTINVPSSCPATTTTSTTSTTVTTTSVTTTTVTTTTGTGPTTTSTSTTTSTTVTTTSTSTTSTTLGSSPSVPTGLTITAASCTSISVSWTASTGGTGGVARYKFWRWNSAAGQFQVVTSVNAPTVTATDPSPILYNYYAVSAVSGGGQESALSDWVFQQRPACPTTTTSTTSTSTTTTTTSTTVTTTTVTTTTVTTTSTTSTTGPTTTSTTTTTVTTTSTTTVTTTSTTSTTTTTLGPPSVPTGLAGNATSCGTVNLSWNASTAAAGIKGYTIYRNGTFQKQIYGATSTTDQTGLIANNVWTYTVAALDNNGTESAQSPSINVSTPAGTQSGGAFQWQRIFTNQTTADSAFTDAVAVDGSGNVFVTGRTFPSGSTDYGGGFVAASPGTFLAKYNSSGAFQWVVQFKNGSPGGIAIDPSGNVVVAGNFTGTTNFGAGDVTSVASSSDIYVVKYATGGTLVWAKTFGASGYDGGAAVKVDGTGNIVVAGEFSATVNFGGGSRTSAGSFDLVVLGLDASGTYVWDKTFGGTGYEQFWALALDASGNPIVGGFWQSPTIDFGGGSVANLGSEDAFVAKYTAGTGAFGWARTARSTDLEEVDSLAVDPSGNVIAYGSFYSQIDWGTGKLVNVGGGPDTFLVKFNSSGTPLWSESFGGTFGANGDAAGGLVTDSSGNIFLTGQEADGVVFACTSLALASASVIVKLTPAGAPSWSKAYQGTLGVKAGAAVSGSNVVAVGGVKGNNVTFGGPTVSSAGYTGFIAKLGP